MALNDTLANVMSKMQNAMGIGKNEITVKPISKLMIQVLDILKAHGYVDSYEVIVDGRGDHAIIKGFNQINKCGVIKPRFNFKVGEIVAVEQKYLPAKDFGIIIVSTSKGLMTMDKAKEQHLGGKLVSYCY
jgi:small subunit ribosomal protein S8